MPVEKPYWKENFTKAHRALFLLDRIDELFPNWRKYSAKRTVIDAGASVAATTLVYAEEFPYANCLAIDYADHLPYPFVADNMPSEWYENILLYARDYEKERFEFYRTRIKLLKADFYDPDLPTEFQQCDLIVCDNSLSFALIKTLKEERASLLSDVVINLTQYLNDGGILAINTSLSENFCFFIQRAGSEFIVKTLTGACEDTLELAFVLQTKLNNLKPES